MGFDEVERSLRVAASVEPAGQGRYFATLSPYYTAAGHPNGGYLQCVMASAALAGASDEGAAQLHVTAMSTNFVRSPELGQAEACVDVRRVGRNVSFVHVTLSQNGVVTTESLVTLGVLSDESTIRYLDAPVANLAPREECFQSTGEHEMNIMRVIDQRLDPSCTQWRRGERSSRGEVLGWLRLDDGEAAWNTWSLLFASDALPPATFPLGSSGWVPTLQLTSYVSRTPRGEWLRARQWAVIISDGVVEERCELFDETDQLVASSTQIAMVRFANGA
ncbi:MAG: thioesterase family protein [Acidimicrobiales bacterium]